LLKQFAVNGVIPAISGLNFLGDRTESIAIRSLTSNILCKGHNEALSRFDAVGDRFFAALDRIDAAYIADVQDSQDENFLFKGHDVERWMLKTLCGIVFSNNASSATSPITGWRPNLLWLKILFLNQAFPNNWGLYAYCVAGTTNFVRKFDYNVLSNSSDGVYGLLMALNGRRFLFAMATPRREAENTFIGDYLYRPDSLIFSSPASTKTIRFEWDLFGRGGNVRFVLGDNSKAEATAA